MKNNLTKMIIISMVFILVATTIYLTLDVGSAMETIYELETNQNRRNVSTKVNFIAGWTDIVKGKHEDPTSGVNPPDSNIDPSNMNPNEVRTQLFNAFRDMGFDDIEIVAFLANIQCESGYEPKRTQGNNHNGDVKPDCTTTKNGDGHGLVQWDGGRRVALINNANDASVSWTLLSYQIDFAKNEIFGNYYSKWVSPQNFTSGLDNADGILDYYGLSKDTKWEDLTSSQRLEYATWRVHAFYEVAGSSLTNGTQKTFRQWMDPSFSDYGKCKERLDVANSIYQELTIGGK